MKKKILFLLLLTSVFNCFSQNSTYKINTYSPRDYGKGYEAANWACIQDKDGVLYFGNAGGLLQYDGAGWSFIPVKNQSAWVKSLAVSDENIIYIGAQGEFGFLSPNKSGKLSYVSLSDQLPEKQKLFSSIVCLWTWKSNVVFQSEEALYIYSGGKLTTILPETSFHISFLINDEFFVRQRNIGLMKLSGNSLQLVQGTEFLKNIGVFSMLESSDRTKYLILTRENGFWSIDKKSFRGSLIRTADFTIFRQSDIYGAIRLNDGRIAVNTLSNGIIITDESFKILDILNKENGLKVNGALDLLQDFQGNIWAGLDNGIVQVHYSSPVSVFGPETGISGNVKAIIRYNGKLFAGTTAGLFVYDPAYKILTAAFVPVDGFSREINCLCLAEGSLLVGTRDELYEIKNQETKKIRNVEVNSLFYSTILKRLFVSGKNDFAVFSYSGTWKRVTNIPEISEEVIRFEEETDNENVTLWLGTALQGIVRLQYTSPLEYKVDKFDSSDGLIDNNWALPFKIDNEVVFSQRNGLLTFVNEKIIREQLPDSLKNKPEYSRGYFDFYNIDRTKERDSKPFYFVEDTKERLYVYLDGDLGYFDKISSYSFVNQPFCLADIGKINEIFCEDNGFCWVGGDDGLIMYNENLPKDYTIDYSTLITTVSCGGRDSVLHWGYGNNIDSEQLNESPAINTVINHNFNTVSFSFAAPFFEGQDKMVYSYTLQGQDSIYSPWNTDKKVVFRNLWEGQYIFKVRAQNIYGHVSSEKVFGFRILSPWYRKTLAYIMYAILFSGLVFAGIRINTRRLVALNKKLEGIIHDRTREIQKKNVELEYQKEEILDSINYALRIQNAVLPNEDLMKAWLGDHFIIHRPKDIVSGDFYWTTTLNQYVIFCVADCTGHGVPGAFMSMLCISLLNEIVLKDEVIHTDEILNRVRKMIIESLKQKGIMGEQKDGMDISICIHNKETSELEYSGANNPLYIIRKRESEPISCSKQSETREYILYEIKGDRMPISIYDRMDPFSRYSLNLLRNDRLYLFSDGICDQFGGHDGKRFMNNALKAALLETITPEIKEQKHLIEKRIDDWQSFINPKTGHTFNQVDDICLMGLKI